MNFFKIYVSNAFGPPELTPFLVNTRKRKGKALKKTTKYPLPNKIRR